MANGKKKKQGGGFISPSTNRGDATVMNKPDPPLGSKATKGTKEGRLTRGRSGIGRRSK